METNYVVAPPLLQGLLEVVLREDEVRIGEAGHFVVLKKALERRPGRELSVNRWIPCLRMPRIYAAIFHRPLG